MPVNRDSPESDSGSSERFVARSAEKTDSRVGHEYQAEIPSMVPSMSIVQCAAVYSPYM